MKVRVPVLVNDPKVSKFKGLEPTESFLVESEDFYLDGPVTRRDGKDVVVLFEQERRRVFRMYQVKAGNISLPIWQRTRSQLEEIFLVPLPDFVGPAEPEPEREGVLVCNGHALPSAFPSMQGWFHS